NARDLCRVGGGRLWRGETMKSWKEQLRDVKQTLFDAASKISNRKEGAVGTSEAGARDRRKASPRTEPKGSQARGPREAGVPVKVSCADGGHEAEGGMRIGSPHAVRP